MAVFNAPNKLPGHVPKLSSQQFDEGGQEKMVFKSLVLPYGTMVEIIMLEW